MPKVDIGLIWAKCINIWGQLGMVLGATNYLMMVGVFYTTTIKPNVDIPFWLYVLVLSVGAIGVIAFIIKIGIDGYYRFFFGRSQLAEIERKQDLIMKQLGIVDVKPEK